MYGAEVQDILAATEVFRAQGRYKGKVRPGFLPILGTRRDHLEEYAMADEPSRRE